MMRTLTIGSSLLAVGALALALALAGCGDTEDPVEEGVGPSLAAAAQSYEQVQECDAGDEAFVRRVVPLLWGRRPASIEEVRVLVRVIEQSDRATLIRAMASTAEYRARWEQVLKDALWVNRTAERAQPLCYGKVLLSDVTTELAEHVRDNPPTTPWSGGDWTMVDLIHSALALDDLSPVFRAHLFAQAGTATFVVIEDPYDEETVRSQFISIFQTAYLGRRMPCLRCHNSKDSTSADPDPALDRTWEVPGYYEKAVYGNHIGRPVADLSPFFRTGGQLALEPLPWTGGQQEYEMVEGEAPWGFAFDCGRFIARDEIPDDNLGLSGYFIEDIGPQASLWDLEEHLHTGFDRMRASGFVLPDPEVSLEVNGDDAFVVLLTTNWVNEVWRRLTGRRLTIAFGFPRNRFQRDTMIDLSRSFVDGGFSLVETLVTATAHPTFNLDAPDVCQSATTGYPSPPIFDPWVTASEDMDLRGNGLGDLVRRHEARLLVNSAAIALEWGLLPEFFVDTTVDEGEAYVLPPLAVLQRDLGYFLKDTETGFQSAGLGATLAWEANYAACLDPSDAGGVAAGDDWIDALLAAAGPEVTLRDAVSALKDRLLTDPDLSDEEEAAAIEALAGESLDAPLTAAVDAETSLRLVCGAFLNSPQFLLAGDAGPTRLQTTPALVAPGSSFEALCAALADQMFAPGVMTCSQNDVALDPSAAAK